MTVGRNDPCPCGSGRKHKKCCLAANESAARPEPLDARAEARHRGLQALERWVLRDERSRVFRAAAEAFTAGEPVPESEGDRFFWYLCFDHLLDDHRSLAETFLGSGPRRVVDDERHELELLAAAPLRVYQVTEVVLDEGLRLHDLWSDERLFVTEKKATHQLERWDVLAVRVIRREEGRRELDGAIYWFRPEDKRELLALLKKAERKLAEPLRGARDDLLWRLAVPLIQAFWFSRTVAPPVPKVVTAEGDPMEFGRILFDILDDAGLRKALELHPDLVDQEDDTWAWVQDTGSFTRHLGRLLLERDRLVLEVSSRQRGEAGRRLIEDAAGSVVRYRSARFETVERTLGRRRKARGPRGEVGRRKEEPIPPEVAAQAISAWKEQHYRTWPDLPLRALGGRTPRHAARLKTIRPRLVDLLTEMENHEAHAARPDNPPYDFGWIWSELGLERPT